MSKCKNLSLKDQYLSNIVLNIISVSPYKHLVMFSLPHWLKPVIQSAERKSTKLGNEKRKWELWFRIFLSRFKASKECQNVSKTIPWRRVFAVAAAKWTHIPAAGQTPASPRAHQLALVYLMRRSAWPAGSVAWLVMREVLWPRCSTRMSASDVDLYEIQRILFSRKKD